MPGAAAGRTTRRIVWNLVAPVASEASRIERGTAASASSEATMTTGTVSRPSVSDAQRMPPVPKVGVGRRSAKNAWSIEPPTKYTKNPRPNTPKTIDGTPARLLTAMRTRRTSTPCRAYSRR